MKPLFTDSPGAWTRSKRTDQTPAEYAGPITTPNGKVVAFEGSMKPDPRSRLRGPPAPIPLDSSLRGRIERLWAFILRRFS
jgi:hypothetical protein